jgi:transposase
VQLVNETGKPIAEVARDLGVYDGTLGNWGESVAQCPSRTVPELFPVERAE